MFGASVGRSGDTAVVGASIDDDSGIDSGSAYIFRRRAGEPENWHQVAKITAADGAAGDIFGVSAAISRDIAVVGAYGDNSYSGAAYIFQETLVDPYLSLSGACPGEVTLTGSGFTPNGRGELYSALAEGSFEISSGACIGTQVDLQGARAYDTARADAVGAGSHTRGISGASCGRYLQVVDLTSCAVSNVVQVP